MYIRIIISLTIVYAWQTSICHAQWLEDSSADSHIRKGINFVYNLSFDSARVEFQIVANTYPNHPAGHFFIAMVEWWQIITDFEDRSRDKKFIRMLDHVISLCEKRLDEDENDITALFFKGGSLGFQGRLYGNREDWLRAANCGREALPIVLKAYKLAPNNNDILLGMGIYNYYAAVIPELYPWVKPIMLLFPKGNKIEGLRQLKIASNNARYANIEATYFLLQVYQNFENSHQEALQLALKLHNMFPNNVIFHKYVGRCYVTLAKWNEAHRIFSKILDNVKSKKIGYDLIAEREANYYIGQAEMNLGTYENALQYLYRTDELCRILDTNEISGYMVYTNLKIGMIYDLQGNRDLAIMQYRKVLNMKNYQDSRKQAESYIKTPYKNY